MKSKKAIETRSAPASLGATHRAFTFYLGNPFSSILKIPYILSKLRDLRDLYGEIIGV